jgi:hypothetical protein
MKCRYCGKQYSEGEEMERHNCDYSLEKQEELDRQQNLDFKAVWYAFLADPPWKVSSE